MKCGKYFSSSSPTKIYPLSLFSFLSHASFVQSRYKKKRVCPGLRSGTNSFCTSTHTFRSLHRFSSSSSKASPNLLLHPGALSSAKEEEKERHSARARDAKKREIQKKNREKDPPEPRKKREKRLHDIITLARGLQKRSHQI